jgi:hypothetical protein
MRPGIFCIETFNIPVTNTFINKAAPPGFFLIAAFIYKLAFHVLVKPPLFDCSYSLSGPPSEAYLASDLMFFTRRQRALWSKMLKLRGEEFLFVFEEVAVDSRINLRIY